MGLIRGLWLFVRWVVWAGEDERPMGWGAWGWRERWGSAVYVAKMKPVWEGRAADKKRLEELTEEGINPKSGSPGHDGGCPCHRCRMSRG